MREFEKRRWDREERGGGRRTPASNHQDQGFTEGVTWAPSYATQSLEENLQGVFGTTTYEDLLAGKSY